MYEMGMYRISDLLEMYGALFVNTTIYEERTKQ